jgi:hypothetical protein
VSRAAEVHAIEVLPGPVIVPRDLLDQGLANLLNAAGVPHELYEGATSYQLSPAALRTLEQRLIRTQEEFRAAMGIVPGMWMPRLDDDDTFQPLWVLGSGLPESHRMHALFSLLYIRGRKPVGVRGLPHIWEVIRVDDPD